MSEEAVTKDFLSTESTSVIDVDLLNNKVISAVFSSRPQLDYSSRLKSNNDYRQAMLSYCLREIEGEAKESVIQTLLPERLMNALIHKSPLVVSFPLARYKPKSIANAKISLIDIDNFIVRFEITANEVEASKSYRPGGRRIAMIIDNCSSAQLFEEVCSSHFKLSFFNPLSSTILVTELLKLKEDLSVIVLCAKHNSLIEDIRDCDDLKDIPLCLISDETLNDPIQYFNNGVDEILNIKDDKDLIINRIKNLSMLRDSRATLNEYQIDRETGLLSQQFFSREAEGLLKDAKDNAYCISLFQIQSFGMLKEKYGNAVGDIIVKYVKSKFEQNIPDIKLMGRYSSDKFIILRDNKPVSNNPDLIEKMRANSPIPNLVLKGGIAPISSKESLKDAISCAEIVIERIKGSYGQYIAMFDKKIQEEERMKQEILSEMENALEDGQFEVFYQPKHFTFNNQVSGAEALVRWNHPKYGVMEPGLFLPLFERTGFIRGLDRYVIAQVLRDMTEWRAKGIRVVPISVNLSRRDFESNDLSDWIINLVNTFKFDEKSIQIEVTESAFIDNPELISSCVSKLHQAGFVIELDDFGAGYSSLTTLSNLDIDILKIDKTILDSDSSHSRKSVLGFSIGLAKVLGLRTVVEGIETEEQFSRVKELGATYAQGFYFSKPIPKHLFEDYLAKHSS